MKTIFIYGAPGVGKLTVARRLSNLTSFSLLHNHLLNDLVETVFEFGTNEFSQAVRKYRLDLLERAARAKHKGIILTYVYGKPADKNSLKRIVRQARKHRGQILFVHLICDKKVLLKRIKNPSRSVFSKIKTHEKLHDLMKRHDIFADVPYQPNFIIDNTHLSPIRAARLIRKRYRI
ncbi:MAG: AAA family ATPase [Candidatus Veblenbacteria bacterium]|nr:AAA family ATPase [Candidatus Veblenbacteria bacterium]